MDGFAAYIDIINTGYPLAILLTQLTRFYWTLDSFNSIRNLDERYKSITKAFVEDLKRDNKGEEWNHPGYDTKLD